MGEYILSGYLLTYIWTGLECFAAILLFDGFSERKCSPGMHWFIAACFTVLDATALNLLDPRMASLGKMFYGCAAIFLLHSILYRSSTLFSLCMTIICYATMSCIDNLCATFAFWQSGASMAIDLSDTILVPFFVYCATITIFYFHKFIRKSKVTGTTSEVPPKS